ncbi:MAG TPA: glycosyltransferase family 1 protein [Opitutaceae bacterium]|nr:glycosyltransferase family 1 protein [Opitutaceae bacterium]
MHVGIDAHLLGKRVGGVERVVRMLAERVPPLLPDVRFSLFIKRDYEPDFSVAPNVKLVRVGISDPLLQRSFVLPVLARSQRLDLLHVQRIAPPFTGCRVLAHVHDLLPLTHPADHAGMRDRIVRVLTPRTLRRADHVLTVSNSVRQEIVERFPFCRGKVSSIYNGILAEHFRPASKALPGVLHRELKIAGPYAYYLGAISPRKNLETVIRGWAELRKTQPASPLRLVVSGISRDPEFGRFLLQLSRDLGVTDTICWTGYRSDAECLELLQHARVFLAPSRGEGFDLPALEAMACGVPVLASELAVHRELLEDRALFFPTLDPGAFAKQLLQLASDEPLRARLIPAGLQRSATFSWDQTAAEMADLYQKLLPAAPHLSAVPAHLTRTS